jgi:hypothetical protein
MTETSGPRLQAAGWDDCFCFRAENRANSSMTYARGGHLSFHTAKVESECDAVAVG